MLNISSGTCAAAFVFSAFLFGLTRLPCRAKNRM